MSQQSLITISADHSLVADDVARRTFQTVRRGFDPREVREYLHYVADGLRLALEREQDLARQVLEANARAESPEITEEMLARSLGTETARVLQTAHEASREIVARAEARAAELLGEATTVHETRQREAEAEAARILASATAEIETARESVRAEAARLLETTKSDCREMVTEAREVRSRILQDLSNRRKLTRSQIDQLLTGRVTLLSALGGVRDSIDELTDRLARGVREAAVPGEEGLQAESTDGEIAAELSRHDDRIDARLVDPLPAESEATFSEVALADDDAAETGAGAAGDEEPVAPGANVGELFAKIRAAQDEPPESGGAAPATIVAIAEEGGPTATGETGEAPEGEAAPHTGDDPPAVRVLSDSEVALGRRDELLEPALVQLIRSLKRVLQDDQNELQDRLRQAPVGAHLEEVFAFDEQRDRISDASSAGVGAAWLAGGEFAGTKVKGAAARLSPDAAAESAGQYAVSLAEEICGALRPRIASGLDEVGGGDKSLNDVIGAAYRDLRGARLDGIAGDHATSAFAAGEVAALSRKRNPQLEVMWLVDDGGTPCPDCSDNALAGQQELGREFPTGQRHPPAHPGCRCLLLPARPS